MHMPQLSSPLNVSPLVLVMGAKKTPTRCLRIKRVEKRLSVTVGIAVSLSGDNEPIYRTYEMTRVGFERERQLTNGEADWANTTKKKL